MQKLITPSVSVFTGIAVLAIGAAFTIVNRAVQDSTTRYAAEAAALEQVLALANAPESPGKSDTAGKPEITGKPEAPTAGSNTAPLPGPAGGPTATPPPAPSAKPSASAPAPRQPTATPGTPAPAETPAPSAQEQKIQAEIESLQSQVAQLKASAAALPPKIETLSPISGPTGTSITITGRGFSKTGNKIFIRGNIVTEGLASSDGATLVFTLPTDSACGVGEACPIKVITATGISNAVPFKITAAGAATPPPPPASEPPPQPGEGGFVTVLAPNGGEVWYKDGKPREIRWSTAKVPASWTAKIRLVRGPIELGNWVEIIPETANDGSELWNIPKIIVESKSHRMQVIVCNPSGERCYDDMSDNEFGIFTLPPEIVPAQLPDGKVGQSYSPYSTDIGAREGLPPLVWSVAGGALPPGLTLTTELSAGQISGIPTAAGTFKFTAKVTDSQGLSDTEEFSITVTAPQPCATDAPRPAAYITYDACSDQEPTVIRRSNGNLVAVFNSGGNGLAVSRSSVSRDNGATWSRPQFALNAWDDLSVTEGPEGTLVLLAWPTVNEAGSYGLFTFTSTDGLAWENKRRVTPTEANNSVGRIIYARDGYYYASYHTFSSAATPVSDTLITRSKDLSVWEPAVNVTNGTVRSNDSSLLQTSDGTFWLAYNLISSPGGVVIMKSADGKAWAQAGSVPNIGANHGAVNLIEVNGKPAVFGRMGYSTYYSYRLDTGTWSQPVKILDNTPFGAEAVVLGDGTVGLVYAYIADLATNPYGQRDIRFINVGKISTASAPALTNIRAGWGITRDNTNQFSLYFHAINFTVTEPYPSALRVYLKKPGESAFTRAAEFTAAQFAEASPCSKIVTSGSTSNTSWWTMFRFCNSNGWKIDSYLRPAAGYPEGEYQFYLASIDETGTETVSPKFGMYNLAPLAILSPTSAQSPVAVKPTFQWTAASGWPSSPAPYTIYIYDQANFAMSKEVHISRVDVPTASTTGTYVYDGPALDPAKKYRVLATGLIRAASPTVCPSCDYISMDAAPQTFWVSSPTPPPPPPTPAAPALATISPSWGYSGTAIALTGSGFTATNNTVTFSAGSNTVPVSASNIASADGITLTVAVPQNLPCSEGQTCSVIVKNANGTSNALSFKRAYTLVPVKVFAPNGGETIIQGTETTLHYSGGNFGLYVGIAKETATMETDPSSHVLGWIWSTAPGDRYIGWDGKSLCGFPGCNATTTRSTIGPGKYKVVALSHNELGRSVFYDPETGKLGNFDLSDQSFNVVVPTASVQVTSPNGGETLMQQTKPAIKWNASNIAGNTVAINLLKAGAFFRTITSQAPQSTATGSFSYIWAIPTDIPQGSDYQIEIVNAGDTAVRDRSDGTFTIVPMPDVVTIRGRIIDIKTGQPVANTTIRSFSSTNGTTLTTGPDGTFAISASTAPITASASQSWYSSRSCYLTLGNGFSIIRPPLSGYYTDLGPQPENSLWVSVNPFDAVRASKYFAVVSPEVDIGDFVIWPVSDFFYFHSDVPLKYMVEYPEEGRGAGIGYLTTSAGSTGLIPLDYNVRVRLTDANNQTFYSPYGNFPLSQGCNPVALKYRSGQFSWEAVSLRLTTPNGGESWQSGTIQSITWKASGLPFGSLVNIQLRDGLNHSTVIATLSTTTPASNGSFSWSIPSALRPGSYRIWIQPTSGGGALYYNHIQALTDLSDAPFTITSPPSVPPPTSATPPPLAWVRRFGSTLDDVGQGGAAMDASGNVYVSGWTQASFDGQTFSGGTYDAFLVKYDSNGNRLWSRLFGGSGSDNADGVAVSADAVYSAGETSSTVLDGQVPLGRDGFVVKYRLDGAKLWTRVIGGSGQDWLRGAAADGSGNVYVVGGTDGSFDGQLSSGESDAMVAKFDSSGTKVWTRLLGSSGSDTAQAVTVDGVGNVYVAGETGGSLAGQSSAGGKDAFLAKYDANGNLLWVRLLGGTGGESAFTVRVDGAGNVLMGGQTYSPSVDGLTNQGLGDAFLAKYDPSGEKIWVRTHATSGGETFEALVIGPGGLAYAGGHAYNPTSGDTDGLLAAFDAGGNKLWVQVLGGDNSDQIFGVAADSFSNVFVTGYTVSSVLGGQARIGTSQGDGFIAKYGSGNP